MNLYILGNKIIDNLSDDLLSKEYLKLKKEQQVLSCYWKAPKTWGHCYVASEALYYMGARQRGYKPVVTRVPDHGTHWFLMSDDIIIDLTANQFPMGYLTDYIISKARRTGFLTNKPSKRCRILIERIKGKNET